jgi:peptidoglycan/xylan/chitin deacetylase (PgdA/CDA1 family)
MREKIRSIHIALKDKDLHIILYSAIVILSVLLAYDRLSYKSPDPNQEAAFSKINQFDLEHSLQQSPENIQSGSIKVPVLIYHSVRPHTPGQTVMQQRYDVAPDIFENQLKYMKDKGYTVISLDYLADALSKNIVLPPRSVVITFDDGWYNQYTYAFPLLKKYDATATFFIISDYVGGNSFLTWDQIRAMDNSGMTIGGHTRTHPYLIDITDPKVLQNEITGSKQIIEKEIGHKIDLFSYPYGHYSDQTIQAVKDAGYRMARSTYKGVYHTNADLYTLKGMEVTDDMKAFMDALK